MQKQKIAAITGICGMTGSVQAHNLLKQGYKVCGLIRRSSNFNTKRIDDIFNHLDLSYGDLSDGDSVVKFITKYKPDYFFNYAAQSHVAVSFEIPNYTMDINATGVIRCLEAIRLYSPNTRFLQASTSEQFGNLPPPQDENTPFHPRSPYAVSKVAGYYAVINYREAYDLFACNALSFNHEGPMRGETFITRKVTRGATRIKLGLQDKLYVGDLDTKRDFSACYDVCLAHQKIIMHDIAEDFCVASGETHQIRKFVEIVFNKLGMNYRDYVIEKDKRYMRPTEVPALLGNPHKIKTQLGWQPTYTFEQLIDEMIEHDLKLAQQELLLKNSSQ